MVRDAVEGAPTEGSYDDPVDTDGRPYIATDTDTVVDERSPDTEADTDVADTPKADVLYER